MFFDFLCRKMKRKIKYKSEIRKIKLKSLFLVLLLLKKAIVWGMGRLDQNVSTSRRLMTRAVVCRQSHVALNVARGSIPNYFYHIAVTTAFQTFRTGFVQIIIESIFWIRMDMASRSWYFHFGWIRLSVRLDMVVW